MIDLAAEAEVGSRPGVAVAGGGVSKVAVLCDLREEGWRSMDLVADMLLDHLPRVASDIRSTRLQPTMVRRFSDRSGTGGQPGHSDRGFTLDRVLNRFWDYPRLATRLAGDFDLYHVVDQSYAQLVRRLPPDRTVVTCHDLHTFETLLSSEAPARSLPFRMMTRYVLGGLERAARVVVDTRAVGDALVDRGIVPRDRIDVVHLGAHPAFGPDSDLRADAIAEELVSGPAGRSSVDLLHVGGTFRRKRVDRVLEIVAGVRRAVADVRLLRIGGPLTAEQSAHASRLGIQDAIVELPFLEPAVLAAVYRRAALTLLPSDEEGFGLPVIESLKCGTPVIASDLPVLREVGGPSTVYVERSNVEGFVSAVAAGLEESRTESERWALRRTGGMEHAARFTWEAYARGMADVYRGVLGS